MFWMKSFPCHFIYLVDINTSKTLPNLFIDDGPRLWGVQSRLNSDRFSVELSWTDLGNVSAAVHFLVILGMLK